MPDPRELVQTQEIAVKEIKQARQGDVLFDAVSGPPKKARKATSPILVYGEATGHAHRVSNFDQCEMVVDENGDIFLMSNRAEPVIVHDKHDEIVLNKGQWYCITQQREYDAIAAERERQVRD